MYEPYNPLCQHLFEPYNQMCQWAGSPPYIGPAIVASNLILNQNIQTMRLNLEQAQLANTLQMQMVQSQMVNVMPKFDTIPLYNGETYCLGYSCGSDDLYTSKKEEKRDFFENLDEAIFPYNPIREWRIREIREIEEKYNEAIKRLDSAFM